MPCRSVAKSKNAKLLELVQGVKHVAVIANGVSVMTLAIVDNSLHI